MYGVWRVIVFHASPVGFPHCRYMNSAKAGDVLRIKSECIKTGKNLAFATVDISKKDDDKLIATGRQTKFVNF